MISRFKENSSVGNALNGSKNAGDILKSQEYLVESLALIEKIEFRQATNSPVIGQNHGSKSPVITYF